MGEWQLWLKVIIFSALDVPKNIELVWIKFRMTNRNRTVFVGGAYRAPNSPVDMLVNLRNFMDANLNHDDPMLLLGDFNLPAIYWNMLPFSSMYMPRCEQLIELAFSYNLTQLAEGHTKICATSLLRDLVLVPSKLLLYLCTRDLYEGLNSTRRRS